jgi:hypothetical protein
MPEAPYLTARERREQASRARKLQAGGMLAATAALPAVVAGGVAANRSERERSAAAHAESRSRSARNDVVRSRAEQYRAREAREGGAGALQIRRAQMREEQYAERAASSNRSFVHNRIENAERLKDAAKFRRVARAGWGAAAAGAVSAPILIAAASSKRKRLREDAARKRRIA